MTFFPGIPAISPDAQAGLVGLAVGLLIGGAARLADFCTLSAIETAVLGRDYRRIHIWGIALGSAIIGTHMADAAGLMNISSSVYHAITWNPFASIIGGLIFGYGMALAGNCGFGALIRAGGGDIRSIVIVVVLGISAYFTLAGPFGPLRSRLFPQEVQDGSHGIAISLSSLLGVSPLGIAALIGTALIALGLRHPQVRRSSVTIIGAVVVGLSVVLAFVGTSFVANESLDAVLVEGPSYTTPIGRTILYLMTSTGTMPSFSVGLVGGTLAGAFLATKWRRTFHWEACDDPRELGRQLGGAVLMGVGGVIALGCTIGLGLTATATLAWAGPVTLGAIAIGTYVGLVHLVAGNDD